MLRYQGISFERARSIMRSAAVKALQLDPLLAEAHAAMGVVYSSEFDWTNSEKSFRRAIDLNPSLTHTYTNYSISTLRPLGRFEEAEQLMRVALHSLVLTFPELAMLRGDARLAALRKRIGLPQ